MQCSIRMAALHNSWFCHDQKTGIVHSADAHGGLPPSAAAPAVPLWRLNDLHTLWAAVFRRPFFLAGSVEIQRVRKYMPTTSRLNGILLRFCRRVRCRPGQKGAPHPGRAPFLLPARGLTYRGG